MGYLKVVKKRKSEIARTLAEDDNTFVASPRNEFGSAHVTKDIALSLFISYTETVHVFMGKVFHANTDRRSTAAANISALLVLVQHKNSFSHYAYRGTSTTLSQSMISIEIGLLRNQKY